MTQELCCRKQVSGGLHVVLLRICLLWRNITLLPVKELTSLEKKGCLLGLAVRITGMEINKGLIWGVVRSTPVT